MFAKGTLVRHKGSGRQGAVVRSDGECVEVDAGSGEVFKWPVSSVEPVAPKPSKSAWAGLGMARFSPPGATGSR